MENTTLEIMAVVLEHSLESHKKQCLTT